MRQFKRLQDAGEAATAASLDKRWRQTEKPLLLMTFSFHPAYKVYPTQLNLSEGIVEMVLLRYASRWGSRTYYGLRETEAKSLTGVDDGWSTGEAAWAENATICPGGPEKF